MVATAVVAGSVLSACGSTPDPVGTPTPAVATTSATLQPTVTATPLSPFEDRAPVQAVRTLLALQARAVNRHATSSPGMAKVLTPAGSRLLAPAVRSDFGLRYPGPIPFTPTKVTVAGKNAQVLGCMVGHGFAVSPKTGKPAGRRTVYPIRISLVSAHSTWKVDSLFSDPTTKCRNVKVEGVTW
ncbi:hypothetical protein GCM10028772_33670 [Nocardioides ultimimeridianus]